MLHELPIQNVRLTPCPVRLETLPAVPGGHFCGHCQQVVHDFTQATAADLRRAQAAAPTGRLCGRFRTTQLAPDSQPAQLRRRLRLFLLVAGLVLLRGLTAQQAWAQAQRTPADTAVSSRTEVLPSEDRAGGFNPEELWVDESWGGLPRATKPRVKPSTGHRRVAPHPAAPAPASRRSRPR